MIFIHILCLHEAMIFIYSLLYLLGEMIFIYKLLCLFEAVLIFMYVVVVSWSNDSHIQVVESS